MILSSEYEKDPEGMHLVNQYDEIDFPVRVSKSVMVTAGYITEEAWEPVYENIAAANVDIKAFTEKFYQKTTLSHLEPVKKTIEWLKEGFKYKIPGSKDIRR